MFERKSGLTISPLVDTPQNHVMDISESVIGILSEIELEKPVLTIEGIDVDKLLIKKG